MYELRSSLLAVVAIDLIIVRSLRRATPVSIGLNAPLLWMMVNSLLIGMEFTHRMGEALRFKRGVW
jgi:hypothetical protein